MNSCASDVFTRVQSTDFVPRVPVVAFASAVLVDVTETCRALAWFLHRD